MKRALRRGARLLRRTLLRVSGAADQAPTLDASYPDVSPADRETYRRVQAFTMTSPERVFALCSAVRYVREAGIPGAVVECGVWRGGSSMAAALTLLEARDLSRELYLFDTFEGMTSPDAHDVDLRGGRASDLLRQRKRTLDDDLWCYAPEDAVRRALESTGYPGDKLHFVKGPVEETLPSAAPTEISILRLDTDWYASTRHELESLFPALSPGGVLIVDDYGHWQGARTAVDEYFAEHGIHMLLNRIDYTGRLGLKR